MKDYPKRLRTVYPIGGYCRCGEEMGKHGCPNCSEGQPFWRYVAFVGFVAVVAMAVIFTRGG